MAIFRPCTFSHESVFCGGMRAERPSPESEIEAFFALPRWVLYVGALTALVWLAMLFLVIDFLMSRSLAQWAIPLFPLTGLLVTALLSRSPTGRGCLRTVGLGRIHNLSKLEPRAQLTIWGIGSIVGISAAVAMTYA